MMDERVAVTTQKSTSDMIFQLNDEWIYGDKKTNPVNAYRDNFPKVDRVPKLLLNIQ